MSYKYLFQLQVESIFAITFYCKTTFISQVFFEKNYLHQGCPLIQSVPKLLWCLIIGFGNLSVLNFDALEAQPSCETNHLIFFVRRMIFIDFCSETLHVSIKFH
jgi:hypothetical protein